MLNTVKTFALVATTFTLAAASTGCSKEKAPLAEGLMFQYHTSVQSKPDKSSDVVITFNKVRGDQWVATHSAPDKDVAKARKIDEQLKDLKTGKTMNFMGLPLYLPKSERKIGGSVDEVRVKKQEAHRHWPDAWRVHLGPIVGHYDAKTGYFLGLNFDALDNLTITLVDSNLEGLMPAAAGSP